MTDRCKIPERNVWIVKEENIYVSKKSLEEGIELEKEINKLFSRMDKRLPWIDCKPTWEWYESFDRDERNFLRAKIVESKKFRDEIKKGNDDAIAFFNVIRWMDQSTQEEIFKEGLAWTSKWI